MKSCWRLTFTVNFKQPKQPTDAPVNDLIVTGG